MSNDLVLPEGMNEVDFLNAIAELASVVGAEHVYTTVQDISPYRKLFIPDPKGQHVASGAVAPASVEEIQAIVRIANKYKLPLWPVSTGKNMGLGMASPATRGQVVLDLRRMNRIISIDPELCTALVEPGVTYQQLTDYIEKNNLPVWIDVPTVGPVVGPVGNTIERGVGYTPYGDHFLFSCGMEVVLANGDVLRTGMGGLKNSSTWQTFKYGYGPYLDGIFTQSNYGIVTKLGLWLMPRPPVYKPFMVRHPSMGDVERIVDGIRSLRIAQLVPNVVLMMGAAYQLAMFQRRDEIWDGIGSIPDEVVEKALKGTGLGMWNTYYALYGTEESVAATEKIVTAAFEATGGEVLTKGEMNGNPWFHHHEILMRGGLNLAEFGIVRWRGAGGGISWFLPVAPARGSETTAQISLAKEILGKYRFDYTAAFAIGWRELHHVISLLYDRSDEDEMQRASDCYGELISSFGEKGWGCYRASVTHMDTVASAYGETQRSINRTIKRALDPNGIIAPGRSGIY